MKYLTFDDILLVPQYSCIKSRMDIDLSHGKLGLKTPFISANMDTVTEAEMAIAMQRSGGIGIIHRFLSPKCLEKIILQVREAGATPIVSIGINGDSQELTRMALKNDVQHYCIDVAHGHHEGVARTMRKLRALYELGNRKLPIIIAGNVATAEGVYFLADHGADIIKIGIGPGSHCTTRIVTGHGVPQFTAIQQCAEAAQAAGVEIIADGGIRNSGDIAKAFAAGADYVMLGRLLAGTKESPGDTVMHNGRLCKIYRGMASFEAQKTRPKSRTPEGVASTVPYAGTVAQQIERLRGGLCSALSYTAATSIAEFKKKAVAIEVSSAGYYEGTPHGA